MKNKVLAFVILFALIVNSGGVIFLAENTRNVCAAGIDDSFGKDDMRRRGAVLPRGGVQVLTIEDATFYDSLKSCLSPYNLDNKDAMLKNDDGNQTITLDMAKVKRLEIARVDMTKNNSGEIVEELLRNCNQLNFLELRKCNLDTVDLSFINYGESLTGLNLIDCGLKTVPDIRLSQLKTICLSRNDLSEEGACGGLNRDNLPGLAGLSLDRCNISDISFLHHVGKLNYLHLGHNKLTDASIDELLEMGETNLSDLSELNLGKTVHLGGQKETTDLDSSNQFTDLADLALLTVRLPGLKSLDLSGLKIASLKEFAGIREDIEIIFDKNKIYDFSDVEDILLQNFSLRKQYAFVSGNFAAGRESEIPGLIQRISNSEDVLYGTLDYVNCSLSDDGKKIFISSEAGKASINVQSGKLKETTYVFELKEIPDYTIPMDLVAVEGDTLADVVLPEGFSWEDSTLDVGKEGTGVFKAVYTPRDTDRYIVVDDIDLLVTVRASATKPTPAVDHPTLTPDVPVPTPETPIPTKQAPTSTPEIPTPTKEAFVPTPEEPTPTKQTSTSTPEIPTPTKETFVPTPEVPTPTKEAAAPTPQIPTSAKEAPTGTPEQPAPNPGTPTQKPDESQLTGNQIEKRTDLLILLATGKQKGKNGIQLTWNEWNGCTGYEVYWSYCDGKQNFKKLKTVKSNGRRVCVHHQLKKTRAYKYYVAAYGIKNGRKNYISKSSVIHVAMKRERHTNVKKIILNKTRIVLKQTGNFRIKAAAIVEKKKKPLLDHEPKFRYYTGNKEVAAVTDRGLIKATGAGTCTIYVIANNGVAKTVKVTVE